MRMITHELAHHNEAALRSARFSRRVLTVMFLIGLIMTAAACSRDAGTDGNSSAESADQSSPCALTTDTSAWVAFEKLADRVGSGTNVSKEELDAFGDLPTVTLWRNSLGAPIPSANRVGNWLESTFWDELGREGNQKKGADRAIFTRSYRYSLDNRDRINKRLAELTGPRKCDIDEMARFWVESDLLPATLDIHFLPAKTEIRIFEGSLLVDTGVVGAGNSDQVIRHMAALLYRKYQTIPGPNPIDLEGEEAVAHCFRVMMNEGITGWIEQTVAFEFDSSHPVLYKVKIIPEDFFLKAQQAIDIMNGHLGPMLDDEATMVEKGQNFAIHLAGMNALSHTGFSMSAVIAAHLGPERLRDAGRSIPAFLAAYQEAALANPVPAPVPGAPNVELFNTVPPLDPEIFTKLETMLTRVFPD
ncbi:MAG: hypothetical protein KAH56_02595 [Candidatus Krumholzibacteria bacterium]|nr:hypothetical protein [Candidatus Krumholzibacteria bacterium]